MSADRATKSWTTQQHLRSITQTLELSVHHHPPHPHHHHHTHGAPAACYQPNFILSSVTSWSRLECLNGRSHPHCPSHVGANTQAELELCSKSEQCGDRSASTGCSKCLWDYQEAPHSPHARMDRLCYMHGVVCGAHTRRIGGCFIAGLPGCCRRSRSRPVSGSCREAPGPGS